MDSSEIYIATGLMAGFIVLAALCVLGLVVSM